MRMIFKELKFLVGSEKTLEKIKNCPARLPFDEDVISFLNALSKALMKISDEHSDLTTFAFWCRKSNILQMKKTYPDLSNRLGRGIVFHSTPSNVPINFAFSLVSGLLAGNTNIVRLPAKNFSQVNMICKAINELLEKEYSYMTDYICFIKYKSSKELHNYFSYFCDTRIIWGGDNTINEIRKSPLKSRATDISFADRFSLAVIDSDAYLNSDATKKIISDFYNDTYYSDQNACTSPRIIIWIGENKVKAKEDFWIKLEKLIAKKYSFSSAQATSKLDAEYLLVANIKGTQINKQNNLLTRISISKIAADIKNYAFHSGFFMEYDASDLNEILPLLGSSTQTISYFDDGNKIKDFLMKTRPKGVDRIVPIGQTMDFSLIWDGVDLIYALTRVVNLT